MSGGDLKVVVPMPPREARDDALFLSSREDLNFSTTQIEIPCASLNVTYSAGRIAVNGARRRHEGSLSMSLEGAHDLAKAILAVYDAAMAQRKKLYG